MGKAITGAVELVGAIGMGALAFFDPAVLILPGYANLMFGLGMSGIAAEAGAIASALTSNRGMDITTRQPASPRGIIYGVRRAGGVLIYNRTTGSEHSYLNQVIVLATHECWAIENLYLDGRLVHFQQGSIGNVTRNGYNFGGTADNGSYTGPDGQQYSFGGKVYCEARYGDQLPGDVIGGLTANSPEWKATADGSPYVGGCTYVYLKVVADAATFPQRPEVKFTVHGKPVYDPRTGETTFSTNPALIINDVLIDPKNGLDDATVNQAQLIAAANVCDEQVAFLGGGGGTEARYSCSWTYDTTTGPGDAIAQMMKSMGGRYSRIGGEHYIWPAYYQGPDASFDESVLAGAVSGNGASYRDLCNVITGTYCAPKFPFNVAGNYFDTNGFNNGSIQNNFGYGFEQTNFPEYAEDATHGYPSDQFRNEDGGSRRPMELGLPCVLSVTQAQRLAAIELRRNRKQLGKWTFQMSLAAFQLQPTDTFYMTFAQNGWVNKVFEVTGTQFVLDNGDGDQAPEIKFFVSVQETSEDIYSWNAAAGDEQTIYSRPASTTSLSSYTVAPPTNLVLTSGAGTALLQPDGSVVPRLQVSWDTPQDGLVSQLQLQFQAAGDLTWVDVPRVDVALNTAFLGPIVAGKTYNARIRSVRNNGGVSQWVTQGGAVAGIVLSVSTQEGLAPNSLVGEAFSDGTAAIICMPFTAVVGNVTAIVTPTPSVDPGLGQGQRYDVYYDDPNFAGGSVVAVATQDASAYRGVVGRYLIGSIVTPTASSGGGTGQRYQPNSCRDYGSRTTQNPSAVFDGDASSSATLSATSQATSGGGGFSSTRRTSGDLLISGFPAASSTAVATLSVIYQAGGTPSSAGLSITINGTVTSSIDASSTTKTTATVAIPAGTLLSNVTAEAFVVAEDDPTGELQTASLDIFETYIDTTA